MLEVLAKLEGADFENMVSELGGEDPHDLMARMFAKAENHVTQYVDIIEIGEADGEIKTKLAASTAIKKAKADADKG